MSYLEKNLIAGERLVFRTGIHWSVLSGPAIVAIFIAGGGVTLMVYRHDLILVGVALLGVAGLILGYAAVKRDATEIGVTNRRVIIKVGLASRRSLEIMLPKVESIGIDEPFWGRVLGYGTVTIHGTGGTPEPFQKIARPAEFRRQVQEQVDAQRTP
jgi:uncharacterized membrane protein YdbT with pleckstrin-like domain